MLPTPPRTLPLAGETRCTGKVPKTNTGGAVSSSSACLYSIRADAAGKCRLWTGT